MPLPDSRSLRASRDVDIDDREFVWRFSRSGGPGGQGVNTTDSRVELEWDLETSKALTEQLKKRARARLGGRLRDGRLVVVASEHRSQLANRKVAKQRLMRLVSDAVAPPGKPRRPTRPSRSAKERRMAAKRQRGEIKARRRRPREED